MEVGEVPVEDTYCEAFSLYATRILVTAENSRWTLIAARVATGLGTSVIMCPGESGLESLVSPKSTPDGRVGALIHIYDRDFPTLKLHTIVRVGQAILTCPTTAAFDGLPGVKRRILVGSSLAKFGDGFEKKDTMNGREVWRIPVMEGEFIVEDSFGVVKGVAGGNILILAKSREAGLRAAESAVDMVRRNARNVILPFPGGIVRSGSKVGSLKYPKLGATTNHRYCPTLRNVIEDSALPPEVKSVYEIVINGLSVEDVTRAVGFAILGAAKVPGVVKIDAGNYGGKLGQYKIHLKDAVQAAREAVS
ncbi:MAG: formylmethanofuran--tetrahydromethanopterin N-formyltransferase [Candidatus Korarchaeota archaeon]|nr:formylmethanofuran--tetrahydromethanopterin N-formyltransferase [Candidatus Korarchaeota archaeon]